MPYLLAVSPDSVQGTNLLTSEPKEFLRPSSGERILSSFVEGFVAVEAQTTMAYFLKRLEDKLCLTVLSLVTGDTENITLEETQIAGPFKLGSRIGVYSGDSLYLLENGSLRSYSFPRNFKAWTSASNFGDLHPHFGRTLHLAKEESLYIPGLLNGVPGFLFVSIQSSSPAFAPITIQGEATYTQDPTGRLLLAKSGEIVVYEGSAPVAWRKDSEISGRRIPFYDDPIAIGWARSAGGFESLRFFLSGELQDFPLASLSGFKESIGFYCLGEALVFAYLSKQDHIRMVVWDL
jgi:hypothetical protein